MGRLWGGYGEARAGINLGITSHEEAIGRLWGGYGEAMGRLWGG